MRRLALATSLNEVLIVSRLLQVFTASAKSKSSRLSFRGQFVRAV